MGGWSRRALLVACAAAALLLLAEPVGGKKAKKRKAGFLSSAEKRAKYADYLFERYDEDSDKALNEEEVDTTNDEEPLFRVHQKYDDTLPTVFDLDRLDKDRSGKVTRHELLPALAEAESMRQNKLEEWGMEALTKAQLLKDIDELHEVTEESETEYIGYEFGKRSGSEENPDKQKWLRREIMPEDKMSQLVAKYAGTFTKEEIADHWTTWVLQGKSWKNMEGPAEVMRSQKNRDGQWKYTEGCIDPDLISDDGDDDGPPDMSMPKKKKKKKEPVKYEPVAFRPGDIKDGESIQDAIKAGRAQKLDAWPEGHPMAGQ